MTRMPRVSTASPRPALGLLLAAALVLAGGLVVGTPSAAQAAAPRVTISKIASKTAPYKGKTTVKPNIKASGAVTISKKTLTVTKGSRTIAKNASSARLSAGTYKVTQKVTYRTYSTKTTTQTVKKKVVGVASGTDVTVTCTASSVIPEFIEDDPTPYGATIQGTCTSPKFDGTHAMAAFLFDLDDEWWGFNDDNLDEFTTLSLPVVGVPFSAILNPDGDLMKTTTVTKKVTKKVYSALKTKTSKTQTLVIRQGKKPSWVYGTGSYRCPAGYPIKGNASSMIYHVPGGAFYDRTKPEQCFATESAARAEGYRKSQR